MRPAEVVRVPSWGIPNRAGSAGTAALREALADLRALTLTDDPDTGRNGTPASRSTGRAAATRPRRISVPEEVID